MLTSWYCGEPQTPAHYARLAMRLHDTATGEIRELAQREPGTVSIYLCGPTVYGPPHIGHGRATVVYDILRRYLEWTRHQRPPRLERHRHRRQDHRAGPARVDATRPSIAHRCEAVWWQAMDALTWRGRPTIPTPPPGSTRWSPSSARSSTPSDAYVTDDGVYLDVATVPGYGLLAGQSLADLRAGGGDRTVVGAEHKRDPADFALWKLAKPDEPAWPSPWGDGRPGWHTECVVMSLAILGEGFDLHCGGLDLKFPHHENERAQAVALGKRFANHWMHHAFVVDAEGEKMSKSLGNFDNLLDLIDSSDPRAFRMALLQAHYRSPVQISRETIEAAEKADRPARRPRPSAGRRPAARHRARRRRARRLPRRHGRRPRHAARDGRPVRRGHRSQRRARRRRPGRPPPRTSPPSWPWPKRSASSFAVADRRTRRRRRPRSQALDAARSGEGLRHRRRPPGRAHRRGLGGGDDEAGHHRPSPMTR